MRRDYCGRLPRHCGTFSPEKVAGTPRRGCPTAFVFLGFLPLLFFGIMPLLSLPLPMVSEPPETTSGPSFDDWVEKLVSEFDWDELKDKIFEGDDLIAELDLRAAGIESDDLRQRVVEDVIARLGKEEKVPLTMVKEAHDYWNENL